jgi:hypothetical protein
MTLLFHSKTDSGEITCGIEIRRKINTLRQLGKIKARQIGFLVRFRCRVMQPDKCTTPKRCGMVLIVKEFLDLGKKIFDLENGVQPGSNGCNKKVP